VTDDEGPELTPLTVTSRGSSPPAARPVPPYAHPPAVVFENNPTWEAFGRECHRSGVLVGLIIGLSLGFGTAAGLLFYTYFVRGLR
jgi:hypothetical protein